MRISSTLLFSLLMITPTFAYTDEQVRACTPDVIRLCSDAIPDEGRVTKCMMQKKKQISLACILTFKSLPSAARIAAN